MKGSNNSNRGGTSLDGSTTWEDNDFVNSSLPIPGKAVKGIKGGKVDELEGIEKKGSTGDED